MHCLGIFDVMTPRHGGIMVASEVEEILSPVARERGWRVDGYLCYEEDCDAPIVLRELLDKDLIQIPKYFKSREAYETVINESLKLWHPEYWQSRQNSLQKAQQPSHTAIQAER